MGIQTMASSQGNGQHAQFQPSSLARQTSWYSLTLDEVTNHLGDMGKPLGSMELHELLQNIYTSDVKQPVGVASSSALQRQSSLSLAKGLVGKSVDDVWREIQQGQKKRYAEEVKFQDREPTLGETTLEDFLVKAGLFAEDSKPIPIVGSNSVDAATPSIGVLSDQSTPGRKRDEPDAYEKTIDRRLRRKIKNRESAARSRARKQAYHNELVSKVSRLEEENSKLKKEMEFEEMFPCESSPEPKFQLRRTSSASF